MEASAKIAKRDRLVVRCLQGRISQLASTYDAAIASSAPAMSHEDDGCHLCLAVVVNARRPTVSGHTFGTQTRFVSPGPQKTRDLQAFPKSG